MFCKSLNGKCQSNCLLLLLCLLAGSCNNRESSTPTNSITPDKSVPHQIEVEEYLGVPLGRCRDVHFYESGEINLDYYTTLISFEVPTENLVSLLEQSPKLPSHSKFEKNPTNSASLEQMAKNVDWWKPTELENAVYGVESWCWKHEGDKCLLYAYAVTAFGEDKSGWTRVYICGGIENFPFP